MRVWVERSSLVIGGAVELNLVTGGNMVETGWWKQLVETSWADKGGVV